MEKSCLSCGATFLDDPDRPATACLACGEPIPTEGSEVADESGTGESFIQEEELPIVKGAIYIGTLADFLECVDAGHQAMALEDTVIRKRR
jgi:hypothetical protein